MNSNKDNLRQYKLDTMNPILKNGYFVFISYYDTEYHNELHYFESDEELSKYLTERYASKPGRRLSSYYINDLIEGKNVSVKLDHEGTAKLHQFEVFHGENVESGLINKLRMFFIATSFSKLNQIESVEEMKKLMRAYNEKVMNPLG